MEAAIQYVMSSAVAFGIWFFSDVQHIVIAVFALQAVARITPWKWDDAIADSLAGTYQQYKKDLKSGGNGWNDWSNWNNDDSGGDDGGDGTDADYGWVFPEVTS